MSSTVIVSKMSCSVDISMNASSLSLPMDDRSLVFTIFSLLNALSQLICVNDICQ